MWIPDSYVTVHVADEQIYYSTTGNALQEISKKAWTLPSLSNLTFDKVFPFHFNWSDSVLYFGFRIPFIAFSSLFFTFQKKQAKMLRPLLPCDSTSAAKMRLFASPLSNNYTIAIVPSSAGHSHVLDMGWVMVVCQLESVVFLW